MRLRVLSVFGLASLQDCGRFGYRGFGVPVGGAFDQESYSLANALVGAPLASAAVEFALGTMEMEALDDGCMAVVGACGSVLLDGVDQGGEVRFSFRAGTKVTVTPPKSGLRSYVALPGGVACRPVLGSCSGTVVEGGSVLESVGGSLPSGTVRTAEPPGSLRDRPLRAVLCDDDGAWTGAEYTVGRNIDRVGLRFDGPKPMVDARSGTSEPSVFGAVQVTEDRTLIVHGPDGPTIGGYRKLACVVRADLDRVGQLAPGDRVCFVACSLSDAQDAWREETSRVSESLARVAARERT